MTNDNPGWRVFFNVLRGLYHAHPVKIDIAGTEESIAKITDTLLYRCYNTFYNLHNMVLSVAGCCKTDEIIEIADRLLITCENKQLETVFPEEPMSIVRDMTVETAPIGVPIFNLGIKCRPKSGYENLRAELVAYIALQIIAGTSSELYRSMTEEGLINNVFSSEVFNGDGYFSIIFDGESEQPEVVRDRILAAIEEAKANGLDPELFDEIKKSTYGATIRDTDKVTAVANMMMNAHLSGVKPFDTINVLSKITLDDTNRYIREEIDTSLSSLSVIVNG